MGTHMLPICLEKRETFPALPNYVMLYTSSSPERRVTVDPISAENFGTEADVSQKAP